jgi:hypothetical protein
MDPKWKEYRDDCVRKIYPPHIAELICQGAPSSVFGPLIDAWEAERDAVDQVKIKERMARAVYPPGYRDARCKYLKQSWSRTTLWDSLDLMYTKKLLPADMVAEFYHTIHYHLATGDDNFKVELAEALKSKERPKDGFTAYIAAIKAFDYIFHPRDCEMQETDWPSWPKVKEEAEKIFKKERPPPLPTPHHWLKVRKNLGLNCLFD